MKEVLAQEVKTTQNHTETIAKIYKTIDELLTEKEERDFLIDKLKMRD